MGRAITASHANAATTTSYAKRIIAAPLAMITTKRREERCEKPDDKKYGKSFVFTSYVLK
jgi:hypothetical protein